jgi:hypothetical protein
VSPAIPPACHRLPWRGSEIASSGALWEKIEVCTTCERKEGSELMREPFDLAQYVRGDVINCRRSEANGRPEAKASTKTLVW